MVDVTIKTRYNEIVSDNAFTKGGLRTKRYASNLY